MRARELRGRDEITVDLVGVVGLSAFLLGLTWLRSSEQLGFDPGKALDGVLSQLPVTLPAAALILGATFLELWSGLVLARLARRGPFDAWSEAALAAMVAAVLKDTVLLGTLGAFGLFTQPVLIALDLVIVVGSMAWFRRTGRYAGPIVDAGGVRDALARMGSVTVAALLAIVWVGPVILQLASPVVPFIDVLPNYVGPVEHLRTFGWFSPLSATQSPIIGPSRTVLGYDGLMGALATITDLPGGMAIAGFILPQAILVAAGAYRLASALHAGDGPAASKLGIGAWALLTFALSQPFARLADARGTVVVVPLVCLGLALAAEVLVDRGAPDAARRADDRWRIGRGAAIGLSLGAAILVHPVIGFFAVATVAAAALVRPDRLAVPAFVAGITAGLVAIPQGATMVGQSLPTLALGVGLPIAIAAGIAVDAAIGRRARVEAALVRLALVVRWIALAAVVLGVVAAFAMGAFETGRLDDALGETAKVTVESSGLLLVVLAVGIALGSRAARSPLVLAGAAIGIAAVAAVTLLPGNIGFLGDALRFEVPKTVHYWLSLVAAAGAATALAHAWITDRLPFLARAVALGAFVVIAALPLRLSKGIDAYHLGEHRWSETFAIDLKYAGSGFWVGFPDARTVVDEPRRAILDALRVEIDAGRLRHDTPVLHVSKTFQQWSATPLGVFAGVFETSVSLEPEVSHQTVGGRLLGSRDAGEFAGQARELVASGAYPFVVLEPNGIPEEVVAGIRSTLVGAGYESIFDNDQGEVYRAAG